MISVTYTIVNFFAKDTFKAGGDLVDTDKFYAGRDKVQHFILGMILFCILRLFVPLATGSLFVLVLCLGILWELFEYYNLLHNSATFADRVSWRDVVADMAGAVVGFLLTLPRVIT